MKSKFFVTIFAIVFFTSCANSVDETKNSAAAVIISSSSLITDDGSSTNYTDETEAEAGGYVSEDLYENFTADGTVFVNFLGTSVNAYIGSDSDSVVTAKTEETSIGKISGTKVTILLSENTEEDEDNDIDAASNGVILQYKGTGKVKYVLSGDYTGTVFIKNKKADAAVVLNNANITSESGAGPALRFSSEVRTFIVIPEGTTNSITDTRLLNQSATIYDTKKGSLYAKGALIFTGEGSTVSGGNLSVENKGYKHAIYSKDYVRIENVTLDVSVSGTTGRDCIRALNAVIIDNGRISLTGNGTITDDESVGIKVEGEDADEDDLTLEYTSGAGFVIINGGTIEIKTVAKGITAHWKSSESLIGDESYTETANSSILYSTFLSGTSYTCPNPYVEINGGTISITTSGTPYENTSTGEKCSPEGIEAKSDLIINAGTITLNCTDDALNAGGAIYINGGALYAYSSENDAIDANGSNGITITGGKIVAIGINTPECAFDCDSNPLKITGGLLVGLGTNNYTEPKNCSQSVGVISNSYYGSANTTMAITDSSGNPVFVYTLPSSVGTIMILSSPEIKTGTTYTVKSGVTASGGTKFHNLYTDLPSISGGTSTLSTFKTTSSSFVYTASSAGSNTGAKEGDRPSGR
ncbi:carbohydrate-binding domain-containing protein [Treponema sp. UBA3813]|uniref:carbohydrate-binding domain-containing protein n=1 Tax=Treponema sp. UBA3813 TaxID=1947715 RepID=UPI0025E44012|nr:carbohydrate-binding domain-containing protein [Treponema sp. UBA3813]